nr:MULTISPECIES: methyltransferase [unclassified Iodidimonas]
MCAGFVYSQILAALVALDLFEQLADGPVPLQALARANGLEIEAARRLLDAGVALDLIDRVEGESYALGALGASLVGDRGLLAMIAHHDMLYRDLADPVALFRNPQHRTELGAFWAYAQKGGGANHPKPDAKSVARYSALMAASQDMIAEQVLAAYPVHRHQVILDVGGGEGVFLAHVAQKARDARLILFDLPDVAARAGDARSDLVAAQRLSCVGGDFTRDPLPKGADLICFVRILHDHEDAIVERLLAAAYEALPPGGRLLLAEPMADTKGARAMGDAYFGIYLLAMGQGKPRRADRLKAMLATAGFSQIAEKKTAQPMITRLLLARK